MTKYKTESETVPYISGFIPLYAGGDALTTPQYQLCSLIHYYPVKLRPEIPRDVRPDMIL